MLKLGVLTILLFGLSCGADYHLKVHLLGKDGTIQNSSLTRAEGLVLATNGSIVAGFNVDFKQFARAQELCQMMGFDRCVQMSDATYYYYNRTYLDQIPYVIQMTNASYNGSFTLGKQTNSTHFLYLHCLNKDRETWKFTQGSPVQYDKKINHTVPENEGVLLVAVENSRTGEEKRGTVCSGEYLNPTTADMVCKMLSYDKADMYGNHSDFRYIPKTYMEDIQLQPIVYDVKCPKYAKSIYDCSYKVGYDNNCTHEQDVVLRCQGSGAWKFKQGRLFKYDEEKQSAIPGNEGVLVVHLENEQNKIRYEKDGTVCVDYFNPTTADIFCKIVGYDKSKFYGNHSDFRYIPKRFIEEVQSVVYDVKCPEYAKSIDDCSYKVGNGSYCSHELDAVLRCQGDETWKFIDGGLYQYDGKSDYPFTANEGVLIIGLENDRTGEEKWGTVCSGEYLNPTIADIACQSLGYDKADMYGNHSDFRYIPMEIMKEILQPIVYDVKCPKYAKSIDDCSYKVGYDNNCTHEQDVVLRCRGGEDWKFIEGNLYQYDNKSDNQVTGKEGVLIVVFENELNGEHMFGTVCGDYFNPTTADIVCQILGYDKADMYGNHSDFRYIPKKRMEHLQPIVYDVKCAKYAKSIDDCSYKVGNDSYCSHEQDLVLRCQGGDVQPTTIPIITETYPFTTPPPFSTPMNNEVKVDFGGADVQVKVGPQKIRAKLSDIWEEIFGH